MSRIIAIFISLTLSVLVIQARPSDRITNGKEAKPHSRPHNVALIRGGPLAGYACGGSIIAENWILTAAHCVDPKLVFGQLPFVDVQAGAHNRTAEERTQVIIKSAEFIKHEDWSIFTLSNDVALIKLSEPLTYTSQIQSILLSQSTPQEGDIMEISGWGSTIDRSGPISDVLLEIEQPVGNRDDCEQYFVDEGIMPLGLHKHVICIDTSVNQQSACSGDSGGPIVLNGQVAGVVSFGSNPNCLESLYTGFPDINSYREWICENTNSEVCQ